MIWYQVCRSKVELDQCPDDNRKGRGLPPMWFLSNFSTTFGFLYQNFMAMWIPNHLSVNMGISFIKFLWPCEFLITFLLIPLIFTTTATMITPQRVSFGKNHSLTTVVEAVSSDVLELRVPPQGIIQQMSPWANRNNVWIFHMTFITLWFYNRTQISYPYHVGTPLCSMTPFLWFYDRMRNSQFYDSYWLQLASMCNLTICWGHPGKAAKPENPESSVFVPLSRDCHSLAPTGKGVQLRLGTAGPWSCLPQDPNTLELRAYRKEPNPKTLVFLTLSLGPSHCLPALGYALRHSSLLLRVQHLKVTLPDASRPDASHPSIHSLKLTGFLIWMDVDVANSGLGTMMMMMIGAMMMNPSLRHSCIILSRVLYLLWGL